MSELLHEITLEEGNQTVSLLNYGAITRDWRVPLGAGRVPVILGYYDARGYLRDQTHMGTIAGRIANRTAHGRFSLGGKCHRLDRNEGLHHLHGGSRGLGRRFWQIGQFGAAAARLSYLSPDGEEGYPGQVRFVLDVRLENGRLHYDMSATPDQPTPINLAQHNYYNLMGAGQVWGHRLWLDADRFTPTDADKIPTGEVRAVPPALDFRAGKVLGPDHATLDLNMVVTKERAPDAALARLCAPNGLCLRMWSDQPGVQLYTGGHLGREGASEFCAFSGICLEPQQFPDALNHPGFGAIIATPEHPYRQHLTVEIKEESPP